MDWKSYFDNTLSAVKQSGHYRTMHVVDAVDGPWVMVGGRKMLQFASNDYLGFSQHPRLRDAARRAVDQFGVGVGASRLVTGNNVLLDQLEQETAVFKGEDAAIVFSSGYAANVGVISALAGKGDRILSDRLNHASIVDGCRLSGARVEVYPHCDVTALQELLKKDHPGGRTLIVTDGVFSMDGDLAPLDRIVPLCREHGALLMVDDAHGTGVLGRSGRGIMEHLSLHDESVIQMGTFSKALGGLGGFVAASRPIIDFLKNRVRTLFYSTGLPSPVAASNREGLQMVDEEPGARWRISAYAKRIRDALSGLGFEKIQSRTPIIPLIIGDAKTCMKFSQSLFNAGILAPAIRPPTVPEGTSRIRLTVSALHEESHIEKLIGIIAEIQRKEKQWRAPRAASS